VTIVDSTVSIPALAAGESIESVDSFAFDIDPTVPDAHLLDLEFVIQPGGGIEWKDHEPLSLASAELDLVRLEIDDAIFGNGNGQMDPGEEVELVLTLKNFGAGAIGAVSGTLSALDTGATVVDPAGSWGGMPNPLSFSDNDGDRFRVSESDLGVTYVYTLTLTDDLGRVQVFNVDLRAPSPVGTLAPDFGGGAGEIVLRWDPSGASDLRGYRVYRRSLGATEFSEASADILEGSATFRDRGLPALSRFEYAVKVVDRGGLQSSLSNVVSVSTAPPELDCFPLPLERETSGSLAVGHLDTDGILDMVVPSQWVYGIDGSCREKVDGDNDSQTFGPISALGGKYGPAGIALGNLDGQPGLEIVASSWDTKELYVFDARGELLPGWPRALIQRTWTTPVLGDLDGDGDLEIVVNDTAGYTYAFHHDGSQVADGDGDPTTVGVIVPRRSTTIPTGTLNEAFGRTTPALFDVDQDGSQEILFGSKFQNPEAQEFFYAWNGDGSGTQAPGWPKTLAPRSEFLASPTIADLDGDSVVEIIQLCENDSLYVWHADGSPVAPFPVPYTSQAINRDSLAPSIALGDFTQNEKLEMVVVETVGGTQSRIRIIDHQNVTLSGWPVTVGNLSESSPVVGDLDGDGFLDVLWGVGGGADNLPNYLYAWNRQGELLAGFPILMNGFVRATPTICDFDGDGNVNVLLASWDRQMHVWDLLAPFDPELVPWPTFAGNVYRNGVFDTRVATSAPAPARLPQRAYLAPNHPNPFNPSTLLRFELPAPSQDARLAIVDVRGRWIRTLHRGPLGPGLHERVWDGRDDEGRYVVSGVYYALLEIDGRAAQTRKLVLVK
jgi:hypothetical protein